MSDLDHYDDLRRRRSALTGEEREVPPLAPLALTAADVEAQVASIRAAEEERARSEAIAAAKAVEPPAEIAAVVPIVGHAAHEIESVEPVAEGLLVRLRVAGPALLLVPPEQPDALGRFGLMSVDDYAHEVPVVAEPVEHPEVVEPDPMAEDLIGFEEELARDERYAFLAAELAEAERRRESEPSAASLHAEAVSALTKLLSMRRADLLSAWQETNPPAPEAEQVRFWTTVFSWASEVLAAGSDRELREASLRWAQRSPQVAAFNPNYAARDLESARRWLTQHGVDLPVVESMEAAR